MSDRLYYNQRTGAQPTQLSLERTVKLVASAYAALEPKGFFQETFGYECTDEGDVPMRAGTDRPGYVFLKTYLEDFWPMQERLGAITDEAVLFTMAEFLFDHVSEPTESRIHSWNNCGLHAWKFDRKKGQSRWRDDINSVLRHYREGFELDAQGYVQRLGSDGVRDLLVRPAPVVLSDTNRQKVEKAIRDFRRGRASRADRQAAVRELFDVMERYRRELKGWLPSKQDESELFQIANNFSIRHNREGQKNDYDDGHLDWLFYVTLATVHLLASRLTSLTAVTEVGDDIPF